MSLLSRVRATLDARRLLPDGARALVACSGGPDSVAMLDVLARLAPERRWSLEVASVDHGLRAEAAAEVALAARHAARRALPFHALHIEVPHGASVQAHARSARYEALRALAARVDATRIAVGHTMDDQAETVLARLLRGASLEGLAGIAPHRFDGVVRPLIDARRSDVRDHCARFELETASDPSNTDRAFERVRIRLDLLPALGQERGQLVPHLARLADDARANTRWLRAQARSVLRRAERAGGLDVEILRASAAPVRLVVLRMFLQRHQLPVSRRQLDAIEHALTQGGCVRMAGRRAFRVNLEGLALVVNEPTATRGDRRGSRTAKTRETQLKPSEDREEVHETRRTTRR